MSRSIEDAVFQLLEGRASVSPEEVARAVDPEGWRRVLPQVRAAAVGLARRGEVEILRKGKPVDPETFRGVWRLRRKAAEPDG